MEKSSKVNILIILALGLGLRLIALNQSFWMDEAITATVVKNFSLWGIVTKFIASDTHPPLYYLIIKLWTLVFGYSEISLRLPSVIFGVLTVYVVYKIGQMFTEKVAIIAALLMATAPLHIYYSQEVRMYSLTTLLVGVCVYLFLKSKSSSLAISLLLLGLCDYLPLSILVPFWVYSLLFIRNKYNLSNFIKIQIPLIVFLIFWFPNFVRQSVSSSLYLKKFPEWASVLGGAHIKDLVLVWVKFIIGRISFENKSFYALTVLLISLPYIIFLIKAVNKDKKVIFLWLWFTLPIALTFLGAFFVPGFSYFRLIFVLPAFYLLIAVGLGRTNIVKFATSVLVLANLGMSLLYLLNNRYWREDWKTAVPFVENSIKKDEVVLVSYVEPFTPYTWYSKKPGYITTFDQNKYIDKNAVYTLDYLMDLTDKGRKNYEKLVNLGFRDYQVYNFRGVGQIRYWTK